MTPQLQQLEINPQCRLTLVAENALLLSWCAKVCSAQHQDIINIQHLITEHFGAALISAVASYHCLMLYLPPQLLLSAQTSHIIKQIVSRYYQTKAGSKTNTTANTIQIPVYYDTAQQWDLAEVARRCKMSVEQVIELHTSQHYRGYALGFTPGFCYLASLPESLHLPRRASPRLQVPQGAVAIAEQQCAIYPVASPGGWHIIGQTPLAMYSTQQGQFSATIAVGQNVQFRAISKAEFTALAPGSTQ
ncbi:sensor histidine kinase inhibitor, KipI family [Colwellia chukchiensis]|uniref:Sensor histidine kinase inhibitor, KipI family n=1 Tax=Colwellia chukchiensis TaxID=641665 RepID=A0A1H7QMP7_9GAMM|nr:5-oxoprolinase subunit PxpB [Colwellia chukchiensis]SEL48885.1 sensor histidine kinase inhibitor, KipI family [Colwellia chukchiensis]